MGSCEDFLSKSKEALLVIEYGGKGIFCSNAAADLLRNSSNSVRIQAAYPLNGGYLIYLKPDKSDEMQSLVIHQLRAPLTAIRWNTELLLSEAELDREDQVDLLRNIQKTNQRLNFLVNDLLAVYRIDFAGLKIQLKSADVKSLILETIGSLAPIADKKKQKIIFDTRLDHAKSRIDTDFFIKTFENLLDNAIEYGLNGSQIIISLDFDETAHLYMIAVKNSGPIIAAEDEGKIFAKFYRSEEAKKIKPNGTGLGLYIAKLMAEANGGMIGFESSEEKGTVFYFTVPSC